MSVIIIQYNVIYMPTPLARQDVGSPFSSGLVLLLYLTYWNTIQVA